MAIFEEVTFKDFRNLAICLDAPCAPMHIAAELVRIRAIAERANATATVPTRPGETMKDLSPSVFFCHKTHPFTPHAICNSHRNRQAQLLHDSIKRQILLFQLFFIPILLETVSTQAVMLIIILNRLGLSMVTLRRDHSRSVHSGPFRIFQHFQNRG